MTQSESQEKTCIVLIGGTGCGKSTLTNILSKGGAKVSSKSSSCTKKCSTYGIDSQTTLMDTPGFDDSDNLTDEDIIKMMATALGKANSPKVKIVWCVEQACRAKTSVKRQAGLINALGNHIWGSVIILCKKGDPDDPSDWQGAVDAASKYGQIKEKNCLGITNLSCMNETKQKKWSKKKIELRSELGYFFSDEIKKLMFEKLGDIPSCKAKIKKVYYHASTSRTHSGSLCKHYYNKCPGCSNSPDSFTYSRRSISHHTWYCHTTGCHRKINVGDTFYHCWPCCSRDSHSNDKFVIGCRGMTCKSCVESHYREKYSCCSLSSGSTGCVMSCCYRNPSSTLTTKCGEVKWVPEGL